MLSLRPLSLASTILGLCSLSLNWWFETCSMTLLDTPLDCIPGALQGLSLMRVQPWRIDFKPLTA